MTTVTKARPIPAKWQKLFKLLPGGYDPDATKSPGEEFGADEADEACKFFPQYLQHIEGKFASEPFELQPWQQAVTGCLFGWKRKDGTRRYRRVFLGIPRGNGKTPWMAGIVNRITFVEAEPGMQGYIVACDIPQAALSFRHLRGQIDRDDELSASCDVHESSKSVTLKRDPASFTKVVSSDAPGKHGANPSFYVCEELHAWVGRALMEAIETSFSKSARLQPLLAFVTTRDFTGRPSVCNEKWDYAEKVRDGVIRDSSFLPVLFAADDDDDWTAEKTWEKANPGLDITVDRASLRTMCLAAQQNPLLENTFKRLHLNAKTEQDMRVISMTNWDKCRDAETVTLANLSGHRCFLGLDMASKQDLASVGLVFPGERHKVFQHSWCPEERVQARNQNNRPYLQWARDGSLTSTTGNRIHHAVIEEWIVDLRDKRGVDVMEIYYDPKDATQTVQNLQDKHGFKLTEVPQTIRHMNAATKEFIRCVDAEGLLHAGDKLLRWAVSNMALHYQGKFEPTADLSDILDTYPVMPSKQSSGAENKIDPAVAVILAFIGIVEHPSEFYGVSSDTPFWTVGA